MSLSSKIVTDTRAARRFRLLAPLAALLALAAMALAPGIIAELRRRRDGRSHPGGGPGAAGWAALGRADRKRRRHRRARAEAWRRGGVTDAGCRGRGSDRREMTPPEVRANPAAGGPQLTRDGS